MIVVQKSAITTTTTATASADARCDANESFMHLAFDMDDMVFTLLPLGNKNEYE